MSVDTITKPQSKADWLAAADRIAAEIATDAAHYDSEESFVSGGYQLLKNEGFFKACVPADFGGVVGRLRGNLRRVHLGQVVDRPIAQREVALLFEDLARGRRLRSVGHLVGDLDGARAALAEAKRLQPSLTLAWAEKYHPIVQAVHRAPYIEGLRRAGLE